MKASTALVIVYWILFGICLLEFGILTVDFDSVHSQ